MTTQTATSPRFWIALTAFLLMAPSTHAEWFRLSQGQAFSDAFRYVLSPDGRWVVYRQDAETDDAQEVWSVRLPSGTPVKLSGNLPADGFVGQLIEISPDSTRVVYLARQDDPAVAELYSVPIAGPAAAGVKLNGDLVDGGAISWNVFRPFVSPDSQWVVYNADQETDGVFELYSVPIGGGTAVKLNRALVEGGGAFSPTISRDSARVVYLAEQQTVDVMELYSVPIAGPSSAGIKLNGALVAAGDVIEAEISPDSARVVYRADQESDLVDELYSVPIAGPASAGIKLNGAVIAAGDVLEAEISPDSAWVVYRAVQQTAGVLELYSVPIAGPAAAGIKLNGALTPQGDIGGIRISPDSSRVVYKADQQTDELFELYSVPIQGPAASGVKLNGPLGAGQDVGTFAVSPDSVWVVYAADQEVDGVPTGHRVPIGGPSAAEEQIWYSAFHSPTTFEVLPDSSAVVVLGNHTFVDGITRIWSYPLTGTPDPEGTDWLAGAFQASGDCGSFALLADGRGAAYSADQEIDGQVEIYLLYFRRWGDGFETGATDRWSSALP